jgi:hypothetical protein
VAGSRHAASATRLIKALPALKGRALRTTSHGLRVAGKRAEGCGVNRFAGRLMARLVTWGSASADRSITKAEHRLFVSIAPSRWPVGHRVTSVTGGSRPRLRSREVIRTPRGSAGGHLIVAQSGLVRGPLRRRSEPAVHGASRGSEQRPRRLRPSRACATPAASANGEAPYHPQPRLQVARVTGKGLGPCWCLTRERRPRLSVSSRSSTFGSGSPGKENVQ